MIAGSHHQFGEARARLGLSIQQMAAAMGVHRQTWSKWERGERTPDAAAVRLVRVLLWLHRMGMLDQCLSWAALPARDDDELITAEAFDAAAASTRLTTASLAIARTHLLDGLSIHTTAARHGVPPERVRQNAARIRRAIREGEKS